MHKINITKKEYKLYVNISKTYKRNANYFI